eukprot:scaffold2830_cov131-Cylindrotheca_fusiformis.AAC.13
MFDLRKPAYSKATFRSSSEHPLLFAGERHTIDERVCREPCVRAMLLVEILNFWEKTETAKGAKLARRSSLASCRSEEKKQSFEMRFLNPIVVTLLFTTSPSAAFSETRSLFDARERCAPAGCSFPSFLSALVPTTGKDLSTDSDLSSDTDVIGDIIHLCEEGNVYDATKVLNEAEDADFLDESHYVEMFKALFRVSNSRSAQLADDLLAQLCEMSENGVCCRPTAESYNAAISVWASSNRRDAGNRCWTHLSTLWSQYNATGDAKYIPLRSSYIHSINALARSRQGNRGARQAESMLNEMENLRLDYPNLAPNTICFNAVLKVWSKSGIVRGAAERSEELLNRMISLCESGRSEVMPDTTSFNTVIHTLAKGKERNRENRAEALLELMNELSSDGSPCGIRCRPDQVSFNTVLDCWACSQSRGSARRATAILQHMEQRYSANKSDFHPDVTSYSTVINAWSRSKEKDSILRAEEVLRWCEEAHSKGIPGVKPNTLTFNSLINCYSKSKDPTAASRAESRLEEMKNLSKEIVNQDCQPDVVTYTSVIDTLAKQSFLEASEKAEILLQDLESAYMDSSDPRLKPNIRTYTSVINAIARSRTKPQRAEALLSKVQETFEIEKKGLKPDVVSFNALINAYGWSDEKDKAKKCFQILNNMLDLVQSRKNAAAKPDIITCNSVLNACAYSEASSECDRAELMKIVVQTYEIFQAAAPSYGYPDHNTYGLVLLAIYKNMEQGESRYSMAKTTFWQCCESGHLNPLVVSNLHLALSWSHFAEVMGPSLKSKEGEKLRYDLYRLPQKWSRNAPPPFGGKPGSRPSRRRDGRFQVTESVLSKPTTKKKVPEQLEQ